jgi:hypothetical protein
VSSIKLLSKELRTLIADLHEQGITLDQILEKLRELGVAHVSRSALGRYTIDLDKVGDRLRRSREVADVLMKRLGDGPESRTAQLNLELMHSVIFDLTAGGEDGEGIKLDPEQAMFLGRALKDLATAQKTQAEFILKVRAETAKEAAATVEKVAKAKGLTAETVAAIRSEILGLAK